MKTLVKSRDLKGKSSGVVGCGFLFYCMVAITAIQYLIPLHVMMQLLAFGITYEACKIHD